MSEKMSESVRSPIWDMFAKQAAFIAALLCLFFFGLATYTYSPNDAGWFYSGSGAAIQNSMGPIGAIIADLASGFFGSLFYSLPPLFFWVAIIIWRNPHSLLPLNNALLCTIGSILYLSFGSVLCFLHTVGEPTLQYGTGGILGRGLGLVLYGFIGYDGATLVSLALVVLSFTLLAQLHWLSLMDGLGEKAFAFTMHVRQKWSARQELRHQQNADLDEAVDDIIEEPAIVRKRRLAKKDTAETKQADRIGLDDSNDVDTQEGKKSRFGFLSLLSKSNNKSSKDAVTEASSNRLHEEPEFGGLDELSLDDEVNFGDTLYIEESWDTPKSKPNTAADSASPVTDNSATDQEPSRDPNAFIYCF
ncbi:DNA translocase FtsK 4TM domain-containing protein [Marinomonas pontica]|nr:DNA translocase FtsK 4TM domain-containing protein [Marinomonas pontica]MCW8356812.1 DNA translocase FtsK 4TM domain-containing protein [Marinomonas pontica]